MDEQLRELSLVFHMVGSRVTCDPPVTDTDEDYLVLTGDWRQFVEAATKCGFTAGGSVPSDELERRKEVTSFTSLKSDDGVNIILTDDTEFFKRFMAATSVAKRLNLRVKDDRIALFQAVLYGNRCDTQSPTE